MRKARLTRISGAALAGTIALGASGLAIAGAGAASGENVAAECPEAADLTVENLEEGSDVVDCDLVGEVLQVTEDMALQLPAPGEELHMEVLNEDGGEEFTVAVAEDGTVSYPEETVAVAEEEADASSSGGIATSSSPSACSDGANNDRDEEQAGRWQWYLGDGKRPAGLSTSETASMLKQALGWWSTGYNNCGIHPAYSEYAVSNVYLGVTTYESDMHLNSSDNHVCGDTSTDGRDGKSTVDFGDLDVGGSTRLAMECTWSFPQPFNKNNIIESDVRFNTTDKRWYYTRPSGCSGMYDLRSVAMHEFGHTYGLGHVSEADHANLTMSTRTTPCSDAARTLGKGDLIGMKDTYGD